MTKEERTILILDLRQAAVMAEMGVLRPPVRTPVESRAADLVDKLGTASADRELSLSHPAPRA